MSSALVLIASYIMRNNGLNVPTWFMVMAWVFAVEEALNIVLKIIIQKQKNDIVKLFK